LPDKCTVAVLADQFNIPLLEPPHPEVFSDKLHLNYLSDGIGWFFILSQVNAAQVFANNPKAKQNNAC
jgi:hypothetical protein